MKKILISADIEGVAGIAHWDEAKKTHSDYSEFRSLITKEVIAACEAAYAAGFTDILIKDAHGTGRNILIDQLPEYASIIRGWSGEPDLMVQGLDESYAGVIMLGYHSKASKDSNPMAHTISRSIESICINDEPVSEFYLYSACAGLYNVPVIFISGDEAICEEASQHIDGIHTFPTLTGSGGSTLSVSPKRAVSAIREGVKRSIESIGNISPVNLAPPFNIKVKYNDPYKAMKASFYPKYKKLGAYEVEANSECFREILTSLLFIL